MYTHQQLHRINTPDVALVSMVDVVALDMTEVTASLVVTVNVTGIITEVFGIPNTIEFKLISSMNFEYNTVKHKLIFITHL